MLAILMLEALGCSTSNEDPKQEVEVASGKHQPPEDQNESNKPVPARFEWLTKEAGIDFTREDDISEKRRIIESTGGGVAMLDIDSDGLLDLFYTGGCKLPEGVDSVTCGLFRNLGGNQFKDATQPSQLGMKGYAQGTAVGDIDGDGFEDLYVTAFGENAMWINNGDGTFANVTKKTATSDPNWSTGAAFADLNRDGHLDLFVVNYLADSMTDPLLCPNDNAPTGFEQCPPSKYEGVDDRLFLNDGAGRFVDQTESAGLADRRGKGLGVLIADLDRDLTPEIYVANDGQANFLFVSIGESPEALRYEEQAMARGVALSRSGYAQASMGIAAADCDRDGMIDLLLTHFHGDSNTFYKNEGGLQFTDSTRSTGLAGPSRGMLGWGAILEDFNGDGSPDLFVANGHVEDRRWQGRGEPYAMAPQLFLNAGDGTFEDKSNASGPYFGETWLGRGVAAGDLDGDGDIDLAISHQLSASGVLINQTSERTQKDLSRFKFFGKVSNRSAIGVSLSGFDAQGNEIYYRQTVGGGSYLSSSSRELLMSHAPNITWVVTWPSGIAMEIPGGAPLNTCIEGRGPGTHR